MNEPPEDREANNPLKSHSHLASVMVAFKLPREATFPTCVVPYGARNELPDPTTQRL